MKVTDGNGCFDIDQVTVTPVTAAPGTAYALCQGTGGVQIGTPGIADSHIAYNWYLANGTTVAPSSSLSCSACAQPIALIAGTYVLKISVTQKDNTVCVSTAPATTVTVVTPPVAAFAGTDATICKNATAQLGVSNDATYAYTWTPGQYLTNSNIGNPVFNAGTAAVSCKKNYVVTALKDGCAFTDDVNVTTINAAVTGNTTAATAICGPLWSSQLDEANCGTATYSWTAVSTVITGTATATTPVGKILQTRNGGADAYLTSPLNTTTLFRRSTTINGITCTYDVYVKGCAGSGGCTFDITTIGTQGCPKIFPGAPSFKVSTGMDSTVYNFTWSPAFMVNNPHAAIPTVTSASNTTITVVITNKYDPTITCSKSKVVNDPAWALPVSALADKSKCATASIAIGTTAIAGFSYLWAPAAGLSNATIANPTMNVAASTNYVVTINETATGCSSKDTVAVNVVNVVADAGPDRTVCNGGTYQLGTPRPANGAAWVYSWTPTLSTWSPASDSTVPQPHLVFASSAQTYTLKVTDPLSGCTASDPVTLKSTVTAGEFAGPAKAGCEGTQVQIGAASTPDAVYTWTPATGLSNAHASNPTLTVPNTNTIYTVAVSMPGCGAIGSDPVTVTASAAPAVTLTDRTFCPSTATAIGLGAAGNAAVPANVAGYEWTPATGLSAYNTANPATTTPSVITIPTSYNLRVIYNNGCARTSSELLTPTVIANAKPDVSICLGQSTQIGTPDANGGTATYFWTPTTGITSAATIAQPTVKPSITTTYVVTVTKGACTSTDNVVVTVNAPVAFAIAGNTTLCQGGTTTLGLTATAAANTSWQWSPLDGVSSPNSTSTLISPSAIGTRTYRLIQTNVLTGCSNYQEAVIVTNVNPIVATAPDINLCAGVTTVLPLSVTSATSNYQYVWSPATGLSSAVIANPTVTTGTARAYTVTITDNVSKCQLAKTLNVNLNSVASCYPAVILTGNIFHDANALKDVSVNNTSVAAIPANLYVTLVDSAGNAVKTVPVSVSGVYDFGVTPAGTYSIVMNQNAAGSTIPNPPAGWISTGENLGSGVGSDDALNGILTGVTITATNVTNANFGIQQPPIADPKSYVIDQPLQNAVIPLNGTAINNGSGTSSPNQLTGTDPEDGTLNGTGNNKTLYITALPNHGELYYNGLLITLGQKIENYNPALLAAKLTGKGYSEFIFQYAYEDNAGAVSPSVPYSIRWGTPLPVTLLSFDAVKMNTSALLKWITANEQQSKIFIVERSVDAKVWMEQGKVDAAGNSHAMLNYTFTDSKPINGINYYRIRMVDQGGNYRLSETRQVAFGEVKPITVQLAPNPASQHTTISFSGLLPGNVKLKVLNSSGQLISEVVLQQGMQQYELSVPVASGLYLILLDGEGVHEQLKLMVK